MGPSELLSLIMKIQLCSFSGYKIQPGRGKTMVRTDGRVMVFLNSRCEAAYLMKRNPREVPWTVLYRRLHKKGVEEEVAKRRTRRTQKFQRAIVGASLTDIMAKRNMKPEVRKLSENKLSELPRRRIRLPKQQRKLQVLLLPRPRHQKLPQKHLRTCRKQLELVLVGN